MDEEGDVIITETEIQDFTFSLPKVEPEKWSLLRQSTFNRDTFIPPTSQELKSTSNRDGEFAAYTPFDFGWLLYEKEWWPACRVPYMDQINLSAAEFDGKQVSVPFSAITRPVLRTRKNWKLFEAYPRPRNTTKKKTSKEMKGRARLRCKAYDCLLPLYAEAKSAWHSSRDERDRIRRKKRAETERRRKHNLEEATRDVKERAESVPPPRKKRKKRYTKEQLTRRVLRVGDVIRFRKKVGAPTIITTRIIEIHSPSKYGVVMEHGGDFAASVSSFQKRGMDGYLPLHCWTFEPGARLPGTGDTMQRLTKFAAAARNAIKREFDDSKM